MAAYHETALREALRRLAASPFPRASVARLADSQEAMQQALARAVIEEIPAYTESGNPEVLPALESHAREHAGEILRLLSGGLVGDFGFVKAQARLRAEQRFPLEAALHAYRAGHKRFLGWLREAALAEVSEPADAQAVASAVADFAIEYADAISTIAAQAYVSHVQLMADVEGDRRAELMSILLEGFDESDGRVRKLLKDAGYLDQRRAFCVALVRPVDAAEMHSAARARRLADAVDDALREFPVRALVDVRDDCVCAVLSHARRLSGWTAARSPLSRQAASRLSTLGNAVLVGIGGDVPSTARIPKSCREARFALGMADVGRRVLRFADVSLARLMLEVARDELEAVLPEWAATLEREDSRSKGALSATLRAYADCDMNVLGAAASLGVHPNTVYARLGRIRELSGLDARRFGALSELLAVTALLSR